MIHSVVRQALRLGLPAVAAALSLPATAQDSLDEVVVVATRSPVALDKVGSSVTVLSDQTIQESQAVLVSDLLATTPGVAFSRNGGPGTQTSVRIRGAESDQTVVLVDGVQLNDPSSVGGGFDFATLLVGDISRIEVLRGPQSTLYGSQAIGGVVNVITREPQGRLAGNVEGEYGSRDSTQLKAGVGGQLDALSFRLAGAHYATDGVSAFAGGTETDPYRNNSFAGRLGYAFTPAVSIDLRALYADSRSNYDGYPPPYYVFADEGDYVNVHQFIGYAGLNVELFDGRLKNRVAYQWTDADRNTYLTDSTGTTHTGAYDGRNRRFEYQGTWAIAPDYQAVFGYQDERASMSSLSAPQQASVDERSAYLQLQGEVVHGLTLTAGARHDDHDSFGSHTTAQFAAAWSLQSGTVLRASWGQGFKAPTLYQLFSDYRNPALSPESSRGWDAGVTQSLLDRRASIGVTYFERRTRDQIDYADCPYPVTATSVCALPGHSSYGYYINTDRTQTHGWEWQGSIEPVADLRLAANLTRMQADDATPGATTSGQRLLRRPDTLANLSASYTWPVKVQTSVALRYTGPSYDNNYDVYPTQRIVLGGYTLVDLRVAWPVTQNLELAARLENAFDRVYQSVYEYGSVGRAGYVSFKLRF